MIRKPFLIFALIWLAVAAAGTYIRLYPLRAHIWADTQNQATILVVMNIKKTFLEQIHRSNPSLPPEIALRIADEKLNETMRTQPAQFREKKPRQVAAHRLIIAARQVHGVGSGCVCRKQPERIEHQIIAR